MTLSAMPRLGVGSLALALIAVILLVDLAQSGAPDLFSAPPALALGSGQAPTGAHCTAQ